MGAFQRLLPRIQSLWQMLSASGVTDTSAYVPFCDGDFTSYIFNNVLKLVQAFYSSTSRGQYCRMQSAAANFINNVLTKKCNFGPLFSRVGIPSQVTAMLQHAGHVFYQQSGCSANQMYSNSKYQSPNPSYYNNRYGGNWSKMFQGMDWSKMFQGMNWNNMNWNNMNWNNMFKGMWNNNQRYKNKKY